MVPPPVFVHELTLLVSGVPLAVKWGGVYWSLGQVGCHIKFGGSTRCREYTYEGRRSEGLLNHARSLDVVDRVLTSY